MVSDKKIFHHVFPIREGSLFRCQGGGAAKKVGGQMNFHVASRGVTFNFGFPAGGGGSCVNCSNKIIRFFSRSLDF